MLLAAMASTSAPEPPVATFDFPCYPFMFSEQHLVGGGGGAAGERAASGAKGRNKRATKAAEKAAVQAAKLADAREKKRAAADAARAAADAACAAAIAPPPQLMLPAPLPWLARCGLPAPNAAQDEFTALHLLWHNTGMGTQRALFELHHCDNTPAQRKALIAKVKLDMEEVTAEMKAAQPGVAQRYREHNNDQQRLYLCACCGERNKEDTGEYIRVSVAALCGSALTSAATAAGRLRLGPGCERSRCA
jgi:hypothetical protein